ncbi:adenylate cyclase, partial [Emiliania huxleyi CCMP1516]|uniref:Guanylate cyclase domain-containing protein n=2 Tax=Emiliania huxleyi TaxID=2903 RepID=A0A0D3JDR1_EMIH1
SAAFVIGLLSDLFAKFDRLTEWHGVHKVKTIGDAYVVCCGAFDEAPTAAEAARRVVGMGLSMLDEVELCKREHGVDIAIRVGVHTGPAIGGIIGTVRFHFDLWGAAIAGAASLEEQGAAAKPGRVHVSQEAYRYLRGRFGATSRGPRYYKGKGEMYTYFL